ncbi:MAG TPA: ATP-binding cassette domain-containing protein [Acidimicrobiales bacterium]
MSHLACTGVSTGYGAVEVVRGVDLLAAARRVTAVLGPNGAGKTTLLLAIAGLLPHRGEIRVGDRTLPSGNAVAASASGVVLVPDDRSLFDELTVAEHMELGCRRSRADPRSFLDVFPALERRWAVPAGALSGGEQQMLAVARGLAQDPAVLLIDEMSMGLAPVIVEDLLPVVRTIAEEHGATVVIVEQHVHLALEVADEALVLVHGDVTLKGAAADLAAAPERLERAYLGT